jgi:hypothetical protein
MLPKEKVAQRVKLSIEASDVISQTDLQRIITLNCKEHAC